MPKSAPPAVRHALVERAAAMLAAREPVTLRSLVAGTGVSTMAVYTHFGGMPGLWRAVRQEGFTRLADALAGVKATADPVRDLSAYGAVYVANALAHPNLYRAMFDAAADLEDPAAADAAFEVLVACAARAVHDGRFAEGTDPAGVATRQWAFGHGLVGLVITGVLPTGALAPHVVPVLTALCVAAGDDPARCGASVAAGWRAISVGGDPG